MSLPAAERRAERTEESRVYHVLFRRLTLRSATGTAQRAIPTKNNANLHTRTRIL